jgi:hypothetical protein
VKGKVQREGEVVHLVAHTLTDLSADLTSFGDRNKAVPIPLRHGRGDEFHDGSPTSDERGLPRKGLPAARHLHTRPAHRHHQVEDAGFPMMQTGISDQAIMRQPFTFILVVLLPLLHYCRYSARIRWLW